MRSLVQALAGAVLGAAGMVAVLQFVSWPRLDLSPLAILVTVAALPLVFLAVVACHEGGHLIGGALARFTPRLFIVGPLKLERTSAGWEAGRNRVFPLSGGLVAATPNGIDRLRERMTVLIAGGPSASVLAGVAALGALAAQDHSRQTLLSGFDAIGFVLGFLFGIGSLLAGLIALIPGHGHGFSTDGARILRFLRKGPMVDAEVGLLGLIGMSIGGQRPRDWEADLVARALQLAPETPYGVAARLMAHLHALDRGDEKTAGEHLFIAVQHRQALPVMSRPALLLQAAYFAAAHEHDPAAGRRHLEEAGDGALVSPHWRPMAEGAILLAEGDPRAADVLQSAADEVRHAIDRGAAALAADLIAQMRRDSLS